MATHDELQAQIAARRQYSIQMDAVLVRDDQELTEARERKALRKELAEVNSKIHHKELIHSLNQSSKRVIDDDKDVRSGTSMQESVNKDSKVASHSSVDFHEAVLEGEVDWTIKGFSWLEAAAQDLGEDYFESPAICLESSQFWLCYSPAGGEMGDHDQRASLAIKHCDTGEIPDGVTFRYTIWVKSKDRGYIQWGDSGSVCINDDADHMLFGPDVCPSSEVPGGVFGINHAQLLGSEWVLNDTLTAKLKVQWRRKSFPIEKDLAPEVVSIPPSNRDEMMLQLFDSGSNCDVTFVVQGKEISAHSQILSAFSEVFQRQFSCGMQETNSKRVAIEDCDPSVFKAFLRYLYSSSFASFDDLVLEESTTRSSGSDQNDIATSSAIRSDRLLVLRQILAISHKYQETRLLRWTEQALCKLVSFDNVCRLLCEAHLYEARGLEAKCLDFIVANKEEVVKTVGFSDLSHEWPQVSLKISLRFAGVSESALTHAIENQENARKRKRTH